MIKTKTKRIKNKKTKKGGMMRSTIKWVRGDNRIRLSKISHTFIKPKNSPDHINITLYSEPVIARGDTIINLKQFNESRDLLVATLDEYKTHTYIENRTTYNVDNKQLVQMINEIYEYLKSQKQIYQDAMSMLDTGIPLSQITTKPSIAFIKNETSINAEGYVNMSIRLIKFNLTKNSMGGLDLYMFENGKYELIVGEVTPQETP
jgi:hypothetical protein